MSAEDVGEVVSVHLQAFPGFFLSSLGARFLRELYMGILADPSGIAVVAEGDAKRVVGFVAGSDRPAGLYARLIRHRWWRFALASIGGLARRPVILARLVRALGMPGRAASRGSHALLMSIGVAREAQGSGAGKALVEAFLDEAAKRGAETVVLTTDRWKNDAVNQFYRRAGFHLARQFVTPEGREMSEYEISVSDRRTWR